MYLYLKFFFFTGCDSSADRWIHLLSRAGEDEAAFPKLSAETTGEPTRRRRAATQEEKDWVDNSHHYRRIIRWGHRYVSILNWFSMSFHSRIEFTRCGNIFFSVFIVKRFHNYNNKLCVFVIWLRTISVSNRIFK